MASLNPALVGDYVTVNTAEVPSARELALEETTQRWRAIAQTMFSSAVIMAALNVSSVPIQGLIACSGAVVAPYVSAATVPLFKRLFAPY